MKKIVSAVMALLMTIALFVPTYADVQPEMRSQSPRLVMRETVGYEPSHITYKWEGTRVGAVSGDNRVRNSPMQLNFTYQTTSTVTATFGAEVEWESQQNYIIGAISQRASFDVTSSRSWVRGQSYGVVVAVDPGKRQMITGYIPWVNTDGSLKVKVYQDGYPNSCYEMTFFNRKSQRIFTCQIVQNTKRHLKRAKTMQISGIGHSVIRGLVTTGQWFSASTTVYPRGSPQGRRHSYFVDC